MHGAEFLLTIFTVGKNLFFPFEKPFLQDHKTLCTPGMVMMWIKAALYSVQEGSALRC